MIDRLYSLKPTDKIPEELQRFGHIQRLSGLLFQGEGKDIILLLPGSDVRFIGDLYLYKPTESEWSAILNFVDNPQYLDGFSRIWLKKAQRAISAKIQQKIWARDGFVCMYCNKKMGDVQLTIDHFVPLELGGINDERNYISACDKCNKQKGSMPPEEWCKIKHLDYTFLAEYLAHI